MRKAALVQWCSTEVRSQKLSTTASNAVGGVTQRRKIR